MQLLQARVPLQRVGARHAGAQHAQRGGRHLRHRVAAQQRLGPVRVAWRQQQRTQGQGGEQGEELVEVLPRSPPHVERELHLASGGGNLQAATAAAAELAGMRRPL